jgi:NAD(P)-dependent dehydrogenase (short-subunit alcohol dehydrogenase family)
MKDVLITGGTRNTGFVIAKTFASAGFRLHITGRKLEEVKNAAEKIKAEYPDVTVFPYSLEMPDVKDINRVFSEIKANAGKLDVFVANAAHLGVDLDIYNTT